MLFTLLIRIMPHLELGALLGHVQDVLCADHGADAQHGEPEVALVHVRRDLVQQVALPADVVVHVHDADDRVGNPHHQEDDPVRGARGFEAKSVRHGPGDHADQGGGLGLGWASK